MKIFWAIFSRSSNFCTGLNKWFTCFGAVLVEQREYGFEPSSAWYNSSYIRNLQSTYLCRSSNSRNLCDVLDDIKITHLYIYKPDIFINHAFFNKNIWKFNIALKLFHKIENVTPNKIFTLFLSCVFDLCHYLFIFVICWCYCYMSYVLVLLKMWLAMLLNILPCLIVGVG